MLLMRFIGSRIAGLSGTTWHLDWGVAFKKHCRFDGDLQHKLGGIPQGIFISFSEILGPWAQPNPFKFRVSM